jgi:thiol-disulfide isomerase/thioredoxin
MRSTKIIFWFTFFYFLTFFSYAQTVSGVYKIDQLIKRISNPDTLYVVNFWAIWCKPCVQELPALDSLHKSQTANAVKVLLVSLDFKEDLENKVNPFLKKKHIQSECVLLDEIDGNTFINKVSTSWSGAIPGTLVKYAAEKRFLEKKLSYQELQAAILKVK